MAKQGAVEVAINRCIFTGPPGVGKSCLKHLLVHNKPKEVKSSTHVMEKPDVVTISAEEYEVEGTCVWLPLTNEKRASSIRSACQNHKYDIMATATTLKSCPEVDQSLMPKDHQEDQHSEFIHPVKEISRLTIATKTVSHSSHAEPSPTKSGSAHPTKSPLFYQAHLRLTYDLGLGEDVQLHGARFVHLLDTGGQPSFQAVLPLLLDVPCTSLFVFNAAQDLNEMVPITYRPDEATEVKSESCSETAWTMMLQSLSSMYNLAYKESSDVRALDNRLPPFRAVIVGTFKDHLMKTGNIITATKKIADHIKQLKKKPYYSHVIPNSDGQLFHLVNNFLHHEASEHTPGEQASIDTLREVLSHPDGALNAKIPIGWYYFEIVSREVDQKFFAFSELLKHARELKCVTSADPRREFRSLLQLFHCLGVFTFIDHDDVSHMVCTDSSAFFQVVSKLLAVEFIKAPKCHAVKVFKETGILSSDITLFNELGICGELDRVWLLRCLCYLGVAACLSPPNADITEYFIPAALPSGDKAIVHGSIAPLLVAFEIGGNAFISRQDLPHGILARLAVELANNGWKVVREKNTHFSIRFKWEKLIISVFESDGFMHIVPIVTIHANCSAAELHKCCSKVQSTFKAAFQASAQAVFGSKFIEKAKTIIGFACPCEASSTHLALPCGNSIVCDLFPDRHQEYLKIHQVWFSHVEGAQVGVAYYSNLCPLTSMMAALLHF